MSTFNTTAKKVLVVGATGATGKHVVQMLLDQGQTVVAVARSQEKMKSRLQQKDYGGKLIVKELSLLDISPQQFQELTTDCDAVVRYVYDNLEGSSLERT
jgi:nucleoside-diphosphate-sugar epimerase